MSVLAALGKAWRVASETREAVEAAQTTLAIGGTPLEALRAFAAASETQLDDEAVAVLEDALRRTMRGLAVVVDAAAWVAEHEDDIRRGIETTVSAVVNVGYAAGRWRNTLRTWSEG